MGRRHTEFSDDEALEDKTIALPLRSKRTSRLQKRAQKKAATPSATSLLSLPPELITEILCFLRPSDVYNATYACRYLHSCVHYNANYIGRRIIPSRYPHLSKSFSLPILTKNMDAEDIAALLNPRRQEFLSLHRKPYAHVAQPDPELICTCTTCTLCWVNLGIAVDFARWQGHLDRGEPIPIIPRGTNPQWNTDIVKENGELVTRALTQPLTYARILERHLDTTIRSILRHSKNLGNRRAHYVLTAADVERGDDAFLAPKGPLSLEIPYQRDEYYLLEAFVPHRLWRGEKELWVYYAEGLHERDVKQARSWVWDRVGESERFGGDGNGNCVPKIT